MSLFQRITTTFGEPEQDDPNRIAKRNTAGELLRERRYQLELDLDSAGDALCIKPAYLAAIEQGRTEELPGPTYAIGFIRAYATYLGLDCERVLDTYREETAEAQTRPDLTLPVPLEERGIPGGRVLLTGVILALCGYGAWYYVAASERERPERVPPVPAELKQLTAPAPSVQTAGSAASTASAPSAPPPAQPAQATTNAARPAAAPQFGSGLLNASPSVGSAVAPDRPPSPPDPSDSAAVPSGPGSAASTGVTASAPDAAAASPSAPPSGSIDIRALADSWVQVRDPDQGVVFARVLKTGETYRVPRSGLILRTGNAGALEVLVDGKPAPSLGALGTLRRNVTLEPEALRAGTAVRG